MLPLVHTPAPVRGSSGLADLLAGLGA